MKILRQFCIILFISFLGEMLHIIIPLPVPASVYGLILMFLALCTGIIKEEHVSKAAGFLIEIMPVMFIPAAAGLLDAWPSLQSIWLPVILITVVTTITVAVIIVTGILGNVIAEFVYKIFHIEEPVARGLALGTASHAIGTAKAMEMGETEGAMSSLAIAVAGLVTVFGASVFAKLM